MARLQEGKQEEGDAELPELARRPIRRRRVDRKVALIVGGPAGTVTYLSATDGAPPLNSTSKNGIFISRDAPFGTIFSARGPAQMAPAVGGLVAGKVTFVLISPMTSSR